MKPIGDTIREMRKAAGLSQMKLAARLGVSYQQVQKYENGMVKPNIPRLQQIADVFNVPVSAFLELEKCQMAKKATESSTLTPEEQKLLKLFRRLDRERLKNAYIMTLQDTVALVESSASCALKP